MHVQTRGDVGSVISALSSPGAGGITRPVSNTGPMPAARRRAAPIPALPPHLEAALGVIEAVQSLGELVDVAEILATLARRLTELVDASACLVSLIDVAGGSWPMLNSGWCQ